MDYCYSKCCPICNVFGSYPRLCSRCNWCFFVECAAHNDEDTVTWTQPARSGKRFNLDFLKNSVEYLWNNRFNVYNPPIDSKEEFNRKFYEAVSSTMIFPDLDSIANRINPVVLEVFEEKMEKKNDYCETSKA